MGETDRLLEVIRGRNSKTVGLQFPVGLRTTTQFRHWLPEIKEHLDQKGHEIRIGEPDRRVAYAGQLLGCDYHTATVVQKDVDGYLYIGTGDFHPLGVAILVDKPVIIADPERGTARDLKEVRDHVLRQRHAAIARAPDATVCGSLVSKKIGQARMEMATELKALAEKHGKQANLFLMDLVAPELLQGYRVDAWVNTACPRIAIEDILQYKQPMLTPQEFEIVLGERTWDDYVLDEIRA